MSVELQITMDEAAEGRAVAILDELASRTANLEGALKGVGEALLAVTLDRFGSQIDPEGRPWAPLRPLTVQTRGGATGPILTRSGRLKRSISYQVSGARLALGPNTEDAAVHQFGATIRPVKARALRVPLAGGAGAFFMKSVVPARPYIGFGPADEAAMREAVEEWLEVDGAT